MNIAAQNGERYELPRQAAVLADPEFDVLQQHLSRRHVDLAQLQSALDQLIDQVRQQLP